MERLKSTLGILMWFVVSTVIAYHIGIVDQNPMLGTRNVSLCMVPLGTQETLDHGSTIINRGTHNILGRI